MSVLMSCFGKCMVFNLNFFCFLYFKIQFVYKMLIYILMIIIEVKNFKKVNIVKFGWYM